MIMVRQQGRDAPDDRLLDIAGRDSLRTRGLAAIRFDRRIIAIAQRSLARMRGRHPASLAVGDPSGQQAGLARIGLTLASDGVAGQPGLDGIPERLGYDRLLLPRIDLVAMRDLTAVEAIGEQMIERSATERNPAS